MVRPVRVGVEWVNLFHHDDPDCRQPDLRYSDALAESFLMGMRSFGHDDVFDWGNDNAWSSDFDHPDFGGDSLRWSDNVHLCFFAGHGGQFHFDEQLAFNLGFSSRHNPPDLAPCRTLSPQWRLGAGRLKWFVLDSCQVVGDTVPANIVECWGPPMQGLHLLLGFIDVQRVGPSTHNRRVTFASDICRGWPLASAWLDTAYSWDNPNEEPSRPIAIAAGASRDEALNRRDNETLDWQFFDVTSTRWLAWKWRG
jgi:hypothetical protein